MAPVVCSASLVVKNLFSFRSLSKPSVDVNGAPLTSGRPLARESAGSAALQMLVQRPGSGCKTCLATRQACAAGTRQACHLPPLGLQEASGHLPAPHATRIWNSSSCRRNRCPVWHRPDECTRPARRVLIRAALEQSRVYTVDLQEHHMNEKAHTVRAARHHAGLVCIATCVQRALDSGREF